MLARPFVTRTHGAGFMLISPPLESTVVEELVFIRSGRGNVDYPALGARPGLALVSKQLVLRSVDERLTGVRTGEERVAAS